MEDKILNESRELIGQINKRFQNANKNIDKIVTKTEMGYYPDINLMAELDRIRMDSVALEMKLKRLKDE